MSSSSSSSSKAPGPAAPAVAPIDVLGNEGKLLKLGKTTKLMIAAAQGSMRSVEKLLRQGARVDVVNDDGHTAMHYAAKAKNDNSDVIRELHSQGLSVRAAGKSFSHQTKIGFTPLHLAENAASATTLIELGADPDALGRAHWVNIATLGNELSCSTVAAAYGKTAVLKAMIDCGVTVSASHCWFAASRGKASTVKMILEIGEQLNLAFVYEGRTIAQAAWQQGNINLNSRNGCDEILRMLNEAGAPDEIAGTTADGPVYGKPYTHTKAYGKEDEDE